MTVTVTPASDPADPTGPVPAAPGSPLIDLRAQRRRKLAALHRDMKVPRWDEGGPAEVWIRYKPANMTLVLTAADRRRQEEGSQSEWVVKANADVLVDACVGVYTKVAGQAFTLAGNGTWVAFDPDKAGDADWVSVTGSRVNDLADALGLNQVQSAVALIRALFFTDGDLMSHSIRLGEFSTKSTPEAEEELLGE